jgi:hypothetical protein
MMLCSRVSRTAVPTYNAQPRDLQVSVLLEAFVAFLVLFLPFFLCKPFVLRFFFG